MPAKKATKRATAAPRRPAPEQKGTSTMATPKSVPSNGTTVRHPATGRYGVVVGKVKVEDREAAAVVWLAANAENVYPEDLETD